MPRAPGQPASAIGVLIANLGTPTAPTARAVRRYLREFLSDRRVVELPRPLWWPILHGLILPWRPRRSANAYAKVWTEAGSPLLVHTRAQTVALASALAARPAEDFRLAFAMRYGNPSIPAALAELRGCRRLIVLPLYPQYSATTTASTFDAVVRELGRWRELPALTFIDGYHDRPDYIAALAASVRAHRAAHGIGERLLFSFHGLPQRNVDLGDPYERQCRETAAQVAAALDLPAQEWAVSFQSRLGAAAWLQPYTDATVREWGRTGLGKIDVICPGFAADCLETLEEIAIRNAAYFRAAGGGELRYIPALNERSDHIEMLAGLIGDYAGQPLPKAPVPPLPADATQYFR